MLKRLFERKRIASNDYHRKLFLLRSRVRSGKIKVRMTWLQTNPLNPHDVRRIAEKHGLDFSDAIQLFEMREGLLAATVGASEAVFVSSDARLLRAAKAEGFKVWNPESEQDPPS